MALGRHPSFTPPVARAVVYAPYLSLSRSRNPGLLAAADMQHLAVGKVCRGELQISRLR